MDREHPTLAAPDAAPALVPPPWRILAAIPGVSAISYGAVDHIPVSPFGGRHARR